LSVVNIDPGATLNAPVPLQIGGLNGFGDVVGGGPLTVNGVADSVFGGTIHDGANLFKQGSHSLNLTGGSNALGFVGVNQGVLGFGLGSSANVINVGANGVLNAAGLVRIPMGLSGDVGGLAMLSNGTMVIGAVGTRAPFTFSGVISGTGSLTIGPGPVTEILAGANTYMGPTTINGGTLQLGAANALPSGTAVEVDAGGTLDLNNNNATIGSLVGAGTVTLGSGILNAGGDNTSTTFSGVISGTGGLNKSGTGTLTLTGANTYGSNGGTRILAGTLQVGNGGTSGTLGSGSISAGNGTLAFNRSDALTVSNVIVGSGLALTQAGTGTLTLTGANTYTGATTITAGTLRLGAANAVPSGSAVTIYDGATLDLNDNNATIYALIGHGSVRLGSGTLTITAGGPYGGIISGTGGLTMTGPGDLLLTGANTYSGGTRITGGAVDVGDGGTGGTLGSGPIVDNGGLTFNRSDALTVSAVISGSGALTQAGPGTLILTGANTYSGGTSIFQGTLQVGNGGTSGTLGSGAIVDNGTLAFNRSDTLTVSAAISGSGALTQAGTFTLVLSGANTYTGTTTISAGALQVGAGGTSGTLGSGAIVNNANLYFDRSDALTVSGAISGSGLLDQLGSGTTTLTAANNTVGLVYVTGGGLTIAAGSTLTVTGDFNLQAGSVTLAASGAGAGILHVGHNYTQSGSATLTVQLGGTPASGHYGQLIVSGTATLAGTLTVQLSGYTPSPGDVFHILSDGGVTGDFGTENLPPGGVWNRNTGTVSF
jgi:autotransporter-associated beta strand protein